MEHIALLIEAVGRAVVGEAIHADRELGHSWRDCSGGTAARCHDDGKEEGENAHGGKECNKVWVEIRFEKWIEKKFGAP